MKKCSDINKCQNNALCMSNNDGDDEEFYCYCSPDYYGNYCQFKFDECQPNDCQNGATCIDQIDGYQCQCPNEFVGSFCEINCLEDYDNELCLERAIIRPTIEPSKPPLLTTSTIISTMPISNTVPLPLATVSTESPICTTSTIIIVNPTETSESPWTISKNHTKQNDIQRIYLPSFNGNQSEVIFQTRRIKRSNSSIKMNIISHNDDGSILHAYTNKFNLLIYLEHGLVVIELNDQQQQNLLHLQSAMPIKQFEEYKIDVVISSQPKRSIDMELKIFTNDHQLMQNNHVQRQNLTVPCFEWYQFGQPPSITDNEMFLKPFNGCIFNIELNGEEKFVKDSIKTTNISECFGNVCERNPCRNQGVCHSWITNKAFWNCSCLPGYRGWLCDEVYCYPGYCLNGGVCLIGNQNNKHACVCPQGYFGSRCESSNVLFQFI